MKISLLFCLCISETLQPASSRPEDRMEPPRVAAHARGCLALPASSSGLEISFFQRSCASPGRLGRAPRTNRLPHGHPERATPGSACFRLQPALWELGCAAGRYNILLAFRPDLRRRRIIGRNPRGPRSLKGLGGKRRGEILGESRVAPPAIAAAFSRAEKRDAPRREKQDSRSNLLCRSQRFILQNPAALFHHVEPVHIQILQRVHLPTWPADLHRVHLLCRA